jgi:hypothetical protein
MTPTNAKTEVLKQDERGRVRVSVERREALLDEFARSGSSGARFARLAGIKYATFDNWVQKRRKQGVPVRTVVNAPADVDKAVARTGSVRLFEALVDRGSHADRPVVGSAGLLVELPGGSRLRIESPAHLEMAAELVALIAQRARARC